ncbi:hypothetical protein BDB01DRAFT_235310 [Pilobolus umbonatus]|nr:hypothetical protein BDB01DRAFT_235310 [Pilobolus umbonatus]
MSSIEEVKANYELKHIHRSKILDITNDLDDLIKLVRTGEQSATISAVAMEDDHLEDHVLRVDKCMRQLIDMEKTLGDQTAAIKTVTNNITAGKKIKDITKPYHKLMKERETAYAQLSEKEKYFDVEKYVQFRQAIWSVHHPDEQLPPLAPDNKDEDLIVSTTKLSLKCPITTTWLEYPMTCVMCKHTFSKNAIDDLLMRRPAVPCPIPGCTTVINASMLVHDEVMEDRVKRAKLRDKHAPATQDVSININVFSTVNLTSNITLVL